MEIFAKKTDYDFVGKIRIFGFFSGALVLGTFLLLGTKGLNFGIEFAGGTEALARFSESVPTDELRGVATEIGLDQPDVVVYGSAGESRYLVRSRTRSLLSQAEIDKVRGAVVEKLGEPALWDATDETGEEIRVRFDAPKSEDDLRAAVTSTGLENVQVTVQSAGTTPTWLVRMPGIRERLTRAAKAKFGEKFVQVERLESVGSAVGQQMKEQGALALLYAIIGILLYVTFRFDLRFGPGAIVSLAHDVIVTVGAFALFGWEFNLQIIAALLAILGYSVNDTVVIYDRIRETALGSKTMSLRDVMNRALNDTLSRTFITSGVTLLSVLSILFFGGQVTEGFAMAMTIGMISGVYSTVYIASPVTLLMDNYLSKREALAAERRAAESANDVAPAPRP
ncbi:MAG: protein translocase subunit SecF [Bradymonadia bacterium]